MPKKRKFTNTVTRVSLVIAHNDPSSVRYEVNKTYVNRKFKSEDVHVFEYYGNELEDEELDQVAEVNVYNTEQKVPRFTHSSEFYSAKFLDTINKKTKERNA